MLILGVETSCDETGASIVNGNEKKKKVKLLSNALASSSLIHSKTGGIIPENAAREQIKYVLPVIDDALKKAKVSFSDLDYLAVTIGPGLLGSLLVGVETIRTLSYIFKKPVIPVNHLIGHIYANFIEDVGNSGDEIVFPAVSLVVSGGHTDLVLIKNHGNIKWLGGTRDDAAGEAFDKIGRLLGLPYPAGPAIEKASKKGDEKAFSLPRPMIDSDNFDFSFSGLKTAALREIQKQEKLTESFVSDFSASLQKAVIDVLVEKTLKAVKRFETKSILLGGGVAANEKLREELKLGIKNSKLEIPLFVPSKSLCTDNGAMIASAAFYNFEKSNWRDMSVNPELYF